MTGILADPYIEIGNGLTACLASRLVDFMCSRSSGDTEVVDRRGLAAPQLAGTERPATWSPGSNDRCYNLPSQVVSVKYNRR